MSGLDDFLAPTALDGSPGQAFASHKSRAAGVAKYFASTRLLDSVHGVADENTTIALIAHLHAAADDPGFAAGGEVSLTAAPAALHRLIRGSGLVGTDGASTKRDYDMALKGLMVIAYRYRALLSDEDFDYILDDLVPANIRGGHPPAIEIVEQSFLEVDTPETENHLLMIESSRYLINQLLYDRSGGDVAFDNNGNRLTGWLLGYLQTIAKHDFLEFSARPYARMSLHALYNLHEFARDQAIRTACEIVLDYTMVKFALSGSRGRRVSPFRRHQERINHQASDLNELYAEGGDQVAGFFMAYTGSIDAAGNPAPFPAAIVFQALISGTAAYRPPPAAYILALSPSSAPSLHRFFHGARPPLPASDDIPDAGLEIYYRSPSFLLTAGGSFLNSGYGRDALDLFSKQAWEETSRAQAVTLIPAHLDAQFCDLLRFEPYPDPVVDPAAEPIDPPGCYHTQSVNIGVGRGLMAGANLRPAERKTVVEQASSAAMAMASHPGRLVLAWTGWADNLVNIAKIQATDLGNVHQVVGVEGIEEKVTQDQDDAGGSPLFATDTSPALASHEGRLFLAWKGSGNKQLNLAFSDDNGATFKGRTTLPGASDHGPALASHAGRLVMAWTGLDNEKLNVAGVTLFGSTAGAFGIEGLDGLVVLEESSDAPPALASHEGRLFLAWKGSGNDNLNLQFSEDDVSFQGKRVLAELSSAAPALASHPAGLFMAWRGSGNENLNVATVGLFGNTAGGFGIEGVEGKVVLDDSSPDSPALAAHDGRLFLAWRGDEPNSADSPAVRIDSWWSAPHLNLRVSGDGTFQAGGPWLFADLSHAGFYTAAYRTPAARTGDLEFPPDNLGLLYAMEAQGMDFDQFKQLTLGRNPSLPASFEYGGTYEFHAPDGKQFSIWFNLTGEKYTTRVVEQEDPVSDLTTLPLVSGEYMSTPGGHDGRTEIRYPGCEQFPLVLDFTTAAAPQRADNKSTCPQPWIDRARALFTIASSFNQAGRTKDAQTALIDAAALWTGLIGIVSPLTIAPELNRVAGLLSAVGLTALAVDTQQQAVDLLRDFTPAAPDHLEYLILLAEAQQDLIVRLTDERRPAAAAALGPATVAAYRAYVAESGADADVWRLNNDLTPLQKQLLFVHLTDEALAAVGLLVDTFSAATVPAEHLEFDITFADARQNLVARLIDANRPEDAAVQATQAIAAYRQYAAEVGADHARAITELTDLANVLQNGGLTPESQSAKNAATAIGAS